MFVHPCRVRTCLESNTDAVADNVILQQCQCRLLGGAKTARCRPQDGEVVRLATYEVPNLKRMLPTLGAKTKYN